MATEALGGHGEPRRIAQLKNEAKYENEAFLGVSLFCWLVFLRGLPRPVNWSVFWKDMTRIHMALFTGRLIPVLAIIILLR